jgi:hypothetical protein
VRSGGLTRKGGPVLRFRSQSIVRLPRSSSLLGLVSTTMKGKTFKIKAMKETVCGGCNKKNLHKLKG